MSIKIYNTATRTKELFKSREEGRVHFYCCGPTVYDYFHIGNARPLIMFDMFRRYLEYKGYDVNYIVNVTDIDDKIIKRANEQGTDYKAIANTFADAYFEGMEALGVHRATIHPFATEHIDDMITLVATLIEKGHAYEADGDVYFDIASFPQYGKLSGRDIEEMQAGARVAVDADSKKKNPLDFVLWKASKPGEPSWESPWGPGRPGWHIECSAMAMRYAGGSLDIHAGGQDLIFPHHENETAQSEAASGKPFVQYWMHNGFLDIEGEKMSKSLGNFLTVKDILKTYDPMAVRMFFLLKHYRSPIDFSEERMREAMSAFQRLKNAYEKIDRVLGTIELSGNKNDQIEELQKQIEEALDDDFNTAKAAGHLFEIARLVNLAPESSPDDETLSLLFAAREVYDTIGTEVMGLDFTSKAETSGLTDDLMTLLIDIRAEARKSKNFGLADMIRDRLNELGVMIEDRPDGSSWSVSG